MSLKSLQYPQFTKINHFCLFQLAPWLSVNFLWRQECTCYCATRKKRYTLLPEGTEVHIQQQNHKNDLNFCLSLCYYIIVELEKKTNEEFNFVYGACNLTKQHFEIQMFWLSIINAIFSAKDHRQITFVTHNEFCSLSNLIPLFLTGKTKLDGTPSKIK